MEDIDEQCRRFEQTVKHNRGHSRQGTREQRVSEAGHQRDSVRDNPQREVLSDGVLVVGIGYLVRVHPVLRHRGEDSMHRDSQGIKPRGVIAARDANDQDRYEPLGQKIRERPRGIPQHIPLHRQGLLLAAHMILQLLSILEHRSRNKCTPAGHRHTILYPTKQLPAALGEAQKT